MAERLGKNELISKIGQGGMAEVYLARAALAQGLHKLVVVKKIHTAFSSNAHFVQMFRTEAYTATLLNHPNIVQVFDYGKEGDQLYLVMEYVEGFDLMRVVKLASQAGRRIPYGVGAFVIQELLKGLDYAHRKVGPDGKPLDIVHRDVSPQNVLVSVDGAVKLVDFGIAKTRTQVEEDGVVKGKYAYMAPEQASGLAVDRRCDVFAAGIILYELLTGRTLFGGLKGEEALQAVRSARIPPPTEVESNVPGDLSPIVMRALARLPENRFSTARDFQHALTRFLYAQEEIYDTAALASFLSQVLPRQKMSATQAALESPPDPRSTESTGISDSRIGITSQDSPQTGPITERKKVLLVAGSLRLPSVESRDTLAHRLEQVLARFSALVESIVFKHEALLETIGMQADSHNARVLSVVGLPVATEEDAARAIDLALALRDAFLAASGDAGIASATGFGIVRGFATLQRRSGAGFDHELSPGLLRMAEALAERARDNEVLVDDSIRRAAAEEWRMEESPLASAQLRRLQEASSVTTAPGTLSQPARVFRLLGPTEEPADAHPGRHDLVGRILEMKALQDTFRDMVRQRQGRVVVVYGDKGMGKRTLVRTFLSGLEQWQGRVLRIVARQASQMAVHATLSEIARQLVTGGAPALDDDHLRTRLHETATRAADALGLDTSQPIETALEILLGLSKDNDLSKQDPEALNDLLQEALHKLLLWQSHEAPLVLILENAHLASELALKHISDLARRLKDRPILAVLTSQQPRGREEILPGIRGLPIHLTELSAEERRSLASQHFVDPDGAAPLITQVLDRAGGNPFYIEAILDSLVEQGLCIRDDADPGRRLRWVERSAKVQIPATVESLVASRLDRLPTNLRGVLRRASVLGRVFDEAHLTALMGEPVTDALADLQARRLIYPLASTPGRWSFCQAVIQQVAYSGLAPDQAAALHQSAAETLLSDSRYRPGASDARVAQQLQLAGRKDDAVERFLAAARYAQSFSGSRESYQLLTLALELEPDSPVTRFTLHSEREEILRLWGRRRPEEEEIARMEEISQDTQDPAQLALARVRRLRFEQDAGRARRVLRSFDAAMEAAVAAQAPALQIEALRLRSRALNDLGRNQEALDAVGKALGLLPQKDADSRLKGELLHARGNIEFYTGRMTDSVRAYAEALALFRSLGLQRLEATMLMNIGFVSQCMGDYEGALDYYKQAYDIDLKLGDRLQTGVKLANIGQAYGELGFYRQAERYLKKAIDLCKAVEDIGNESDAVTTLGQVRLWQHDVGPARDLLLEGLSLAKASESAYGEMRARIYVALARLEAGEPPEMALADAHEATELSRRSDMPQGVVFGLMIEAKALLSLGRNEEALARSSEAMSLVATGTPIVGVEEALRQHAVILHALGRSAEARPFIQRSLEEVAKKARRLKRGDYLASFLKTPIIDGITRTYTQIVGPPGDLLPSPPPSRNAT